MRAVPTPDGLAARTGRAVAAAAGAGRALGLTVSEPRVLHDVFSVVVHLAPAPVVARVPTVLPRTLAADPGAQAEQQRAELAVAGWLADCGHPVVAPSPLVPREPVRRDGLSMTFWSLVHEVPGAHLDAGRRAQLTADLHAALREYPAEPAFLVPLDASIPDGLARLADRPELLDAADLDRARREWTRLEPLVSSRDAFEEAFAGPRVQALHGDAPFWNVIVTADGELCSDFEHVCLGPVEWDLALAGAELHAAYDASAIRLGLRPLDPRLLGVIEAARMLQVVASLAVAPEVPGLAGWLGPVLEAWRARPLAGGLAEAG